MVKGLDMEQCRCLAGLNGSLALEFRTVEVGRARGWVGRAAVLARDLSVCGGESGRGCTCLHGQCLHLYLETPSERGPSAASMAAGCLLTYLW